MREIRACYVNNGQSIGRISEDVRPPPRHKTPIAMSRILSIPAFLILALAMADATAAQNILDRARRAAKRGAERAVEREAERRADRAVTGAIECVVGDRACAEQAAAEECPLALKRSDPSSS
jgi:hypothetical protein